MEEHWDAMKIRAQLKKRLQSSHFSFSHQTVNPRKMRCKWDDGLKAVKFCDAMVADKKEVSRDVDW